MKHTPQQLLNQAREQFKSIKEELLPLNDRPMLREAINNTADSLTREFDLLDLREQITYPQVVSFSYWKKTHRGRKSVKETHKVASFDDLKASIDLLACLYH